MRDQKKHADTEGEVQMGTTRADGRPRLDEEAWEQCHDVATFTRWCPVIRGRRSRAGDQRVEQAQTGEYDRRNAVVCSHTIKVDEASGSDP